jgi:hypothetical protein
MNFSPRGRSVATRLKAEGNNSVGQANGLIGRALGRGKQALQRCLRAAKS